MFGWTHLYPENIHFVWIALLVIGLLAVLELRSRDALSTFLSPVMQRRLTAQASTGRMLARLGLFFIAMLMAIGALMRPQAEGETDVVSLEASADVVFALDTSRSMLAEDTAPNRLARAKAEINQMVARLEGHRVGLIAFAGRAVQICPLTPDHSFFSTVLSTVDTRSAGKGGTRIGEAIKLAVRGFPSTRGAKMIILITDGDDQDSYAQEAAKLAHDAGVKIVVLGLGSPEGSEITLTAPQTGAKQKLMHDGQVVISKLNSEQLKQIALVTEGAYIPVETSAIDLDSIMKSYVEPIMRAAGDAAQRRIPAERFQWYVLGSLVFVMAALWVGSTTDRPTGVGRRAS
ncbi:MAG: VWA domain-containing protein [Kofleriaceae bacterium]|nr:VWA domain-containing protein [Kofleriaceae bacterium]